jgi:small GTP-binding protein
MTTISKKICMVGEFGVGKTSLIRRFLDQQFSDHYLSTIGVKISRKQLSIQTSDDPEQSVQLIVWDVEGKTRFQPIAPSYLEGAMGAIVVADLQRPETIAHIQEHMELISAVNQQETDLIVALNKLDTFPEEKAAVLLQEQLSRFATNAKVVSVYLTSAKTGESVDQMFQALAERLLHNHKIRNAALQSR